MSAADDNDRALVVFLDGQDPVALARLKALVDARTRQGQKVPADGPETYRGIPVPGRIQQDRAKNAPYSALFHAWREGVNAALDVAVPLLTAFADTEPCEFDSLGACMTHDYPPPLCADGEARKLIKEARNEG